MSDFPPKISDRCPKSYFLVIQNARFLFLVKKQMQFVQLLLYTKLVWCLEQCLKKSILMPGSSSLDVTEMGKRERLELGHQAKVFADFRKMGGGYNKVQKVQFLHFPGSFEESSHFSILETKLYFFRLLEREER